MKRAPIGFIGRPAAQAAFFFLPFLLMVITTPDLFGQVDTTNWTDPLTHHPERGRVIRQFLPDTGPDSMAVALPASGGEVKHAYCFDADKCRLRYAWTGGFIHVSYHKRDGPAEIKGTVFHRAEQGFPLRFGSRELKTDRADREFLGFQLINNIPAFFYRVRGNKIRHRITQRREGKGLTHHFQIKNVKEPVWFVFDDAGDVRYRASKGKRKNGAIRLPPEEASEFSVSLDYQPDSDE